MSTTAVEEVITRAIKDEVFRQQLFASPEEALAGYDLTDDEINTLSSLDEENFDTFAGELAPRETKSRWLPGAG